MKKIIILSLYIFCISYFSVQTYANNSGYIKQVSQKKVSLKNRITIEQLVSSILHKYTYKVICSKNSCTGNRRSISDVYQKFTYTFTSTGGINQTGYLVVDGNYDGEKILYKDGEMSKYADRRDMVVLSQLDSYLAQKYSPQIMTTSGVLIKSLLSIENGNDYCQKSIGEGRKRVDFHIQGGWLAYGRLKTGFVDGYMSGQRYYTYIRDQQANCWNSNSGLTASLGINPYGLVTIDFTQEHGSNPYEGDVSCDTILPLLCYKK